jgi:hypothetical protein
MIGPPELEGLYTSVLEGPGWREEARLLRLAEFLR